MATFTDDRGTERTLRVTVATIKKARDELGVDLGMICAGDLVGRLTTDPVLLVDLLHLIAAPDEDPNGFAEALGDSIGDAARALFEAVASFFDALTSGTSSTMVRATLRTVERAHELAAAKTATMTDQEIDAILDKTIEALMSGPRSTAPPASSASTPTPSPSASSPPWPRPASGPNGTAPPPSSPTP